MKITKRQLRRIISEIGSPPDMSDPDWHPNMSQEWERQAQSEESHGRPSYKFNQGVQGEYAPGESVLEDLMVAVDEAIDNAAGQIDLDYQDDPLTTRQVINFVMQSLRER